MNKKDFDILLEDRLKKTMEVLASKNAEYASDTDKLHNFKRAGEMQRCSPEKALIGMWTKHIISILDIVDDIEKNNDDLQYLKSIYTKKWFNKYIVLPRIKILEEKIGDAINYLILLEALIKERYSW